MEAAEGVIDFAYYFFLKLGKSVEGDFIDFKKKCLDFFLKFFLKLALLLGRFN